MLRTLRLREAEIDDDGVAALVHTPIGEGENVLPALEELDLVCNKITDAACNAIVTAIERRGMYALATAPRDPPQLARREPLRLRRRGDGGGTGGPARSVAGRCSALQPLSPLACWVVFRGIALTGQILRLSVNN